MAEENNYFSPSLLSLEQQEGSDTYYIPKLQQTIEAGEYASERDVEIKALKKMAGKNNNAFIMGMRNLDEPVSPALFDGYLEGKVKESGIETKSSAWEATKGFAEGVVKAPARWAGYAATNTLPLIAKTATSLYALSGATGDVESADKWVREANKGIEAWAKEVQRITGIEDASTVENVVGNALGSVWGSVAIGGIFGGGSVAPMFGVSAAQDTYVRQREAGTGMGESLVRGAIHGTGEAALERLQFNRIFGALAKKSKPIAIVKDLLENAVQEGLQQANELGANWNIDNRSLIEKLQEIGVSMVGGAVASLGGSVGGNILNRNTVNEVGDLMKKTGHSDEEIASVKNELNKIVDTDELQQAANQVAKDELTTVALTYKEQAQAASDALVVGLEDAIKRNELVDIGGALSGDKTEGMPPLYQLGDIQIDTTKNPNIGMVLYQAEQAGQPMQTLGQVLDWTKGKLNLEQARKMNTGINAVYNKTYQQLKAIGQDETLADANARVRSAMAYTLAKNYDMTPEQADNMLGGIIQQRASEFNQAGALQQNDIAQRINEIDAEEKAKGVPEYTAPTININGVERQTTNSDGNPIAKSEKSLRYFYDWFGDSKVVDEQGRPLVVYHGSTKVFDTFDISKTSKESNLGAGFYFTNNEDDVSRNYEGGGPDFENRVERIAERIQEEEDISYEEAEEKARKQEFDESVKYPVYLKMENPFIIGGENETILTFEEKYNEETDEYGEPEGTLIEFAYQLDNALADVGIDYQISQRLFEKAAENGGEISASEIDDILRNDEELYSLYDYESSQGQLLSDVVGIEYDGFIDNTVNKKFGYERKTGKPMEGMDESTSHYVVFDPNQIKSTSNRGTYSGSENIYLQSAYAGSRVDYDRPSLEAIGSGEGQQVHGWGLYYALSKDVANKNYYERFKRETPAHFKYDGKSIYIKLEELVGQEFMNESTLATIERVAKKSDVANIKENLLAGLEKESKKLKSSNKYDSIEKKKILDAINVIENMDDSLFEFVKPQLHEVDIPESPYLLDEQKKFSEQSDFVKNSFNELYNSLTPLQKKLFQDKTDVKNYKLTTGKKLYSGLAYAMYQTNEGKNGSELASKLLEKYGIKGITYFGETDGRCFVIFNPDDVKVIQKFYQDEANPRGAYYNNTVYLFENANESTFVHEMAHSYMDVLERLAQNGNTKAQSDLNVIRNWLGKKQGQAFTQADWERFARGFEMYMREGKSPNQYLGGEKGVFARFRDWLMHIYAGIKTLRVKNEKGVEEPVRINNQIRRFYDEMLGGTSIDEVFDTAEKNQQSLEVLDNKLKQLAEAQQKLAEEKAKLVREMANNVKPDTTWANVKDWGNNLWESARELPSNVLQSSYERLAKIDKKLGLLIQRSEQSQGLRIKRWTEQIKPFYEAFNKLSNEDKAKVQFYLLNQQWGEVEDLIGQDATNAVRDMLKTIYDELIESGVEVGYRDNYFPRSVLDYDGLLQEMGLTYPQLRKDMEEAIGKNATPEEQAEWLDKHIMGFQGGNVSTQSNKYTKERKLDLITNQMAKYYRPSMETLVNYVEGMSKLLSMREVFGKDFDKKESVGDNIERLLADKKISKKEIDEVRRVLSALYLPNGMGNKFLQAMRQYGYATKLSYSTTVRQFADIGMMMKVNGVLNTLDALFHPDKRITLENLGIDPLGEEFNTSKKDFGGKIANLSTKWKGINWADAIMKNAFMRANYKSLQQLAKTPDKFHEKYDALFGDETDTLIKDLNEDKVSEPVKVLLFHEISKIQPISRSAMPTAYLSNPNGRVFYMFKTFSLHRAEYMVSELANDFRNGDYKKAGKDIMADVAVIGWEGLMELLIAFLKYGWQAFAAKEVLDTFAGSGLGVIGLNKHQALQLTRGQVDDFFQQMVGLGTPIDDIAYLMRHYDEDDKLLRAFLPDMILEPLLVGPKPISNKKTKVK